MSADDDHASPLAVLPAPYEALADLAQGLAQAFAEDPVYHWLFPEAKGRREKMARLFAVLLRPSLRAGTVFTTPHHEGVAVWEPPQGVGVGWWGRIQQEWHLAKLLGKHVGRGWQWWRLVETRQPRYPHWKLALLGVRPEHQGRGIGSALLRPMLARCDAEGWPIYLDTGQPANLPFYRRFGFAVVRQVPLPQGPTVFQMIRRPR